MIFQRIARSAVPIEAVVALVFVAVLCGAALLAYLTGRDHGADAAAKRVSALQVEIEALRSSVAAADFLEATRKRFAAANEAAYKEALRQSEAALAAANHEKAQVAKELDGWKRNWDRQSRTCAAARQALDTACPELKDY